MNPKPPFVPRGQIYRDQAERIALMARNGAIQFEFILHTSLGWQAGTRVQPDLLLELQRLAINQLFRCAGCFRDGSVRLGSRDESDQNSDGYHKPPPHDDVLALVAEMCEYLNSRWDQSTPVHLAAYAMWRVNWIHPFFGGNGRTARAFSYLVLCCKLRFMPPAEEKNMPELIEENRDPYYAALRSADEAWLAGRLDLSAMEDYLSEILAVQLVAVHERATGRQHGGEDLTQTPIQ